MQVYKGNAHELSQSSRGWFMGHFMGVPGDPLYSSDVEVKWGEHPAGESRAAWSANDATSMSILLCGRFRISFADQDVILEHIGDFVIWQPHVLHTWHAETQSTILTIRWPSR
jgi:hypothetical protein